MDIWSVLLGFVVMVLTLFFNRSLDYVWQPLRIDYKMKLLKEAMKDLKARYTDVNVQVRKAKLELNTCINEVKRWLQKVESIQDEVIDIEAETFKWRLDHGGFLGYLKFWKRHSIGHKVVNKLKEVNKLFDQGDFKDVATMPPPPAVQQLPSISRLCSMDCNRNQILEHLREDEVRSIGIWGMGGVGKTTLLKEINNYFAYNQHLLFDHVIFIVASRNVIDEELQKKILKGLGLPLKEDDDLSIRATHLLNFVKEKKVLLLLDDLWEYVNLVDLGFPLKQGKCKMVFTTRSNEVCCSMNASKELKVQLLDSKEAWSLFNENVGKNIIEADPNIRSRAKKVIEECCGLPLALITIGKVMSEKKTWRQWQDALNSLSHSGSLSDKMFRTLEFSYENLPDDRTRACFLSCSMWPEDYVIMRNDLIMCWMGLGLLDDCSEISIAFDKGHSIIEGLINVCLLEHVEGYREDNVKMHDVLRDMALWIALDHGMSKNKWIVKIGLELRDFQVQDWAEPERISLMDNQINSFFGQPPVGSKLSVLLLKMNRCLESIPHGIFNRLGSLTYLDLSYCYSIKNLPEDICKLVNLEFLDISHTKIKYLSDGFNNLVKLKYLLLKCTRVKSISWELILSLPNLKMLDLYCCPAAKEMESQGGIEALAGRQITLVIDVFTVSALNHLFNLSTICILKLSINRLEGIESLELSKPTRDGLRSLEISYCWYLKELVISGSRFENLQNLETLSIWSCNLLERIVWRGVTPTDFLPNLCSLTIKSCHMLRNISWVSQLPNLAFLTVDGCNELEMVTGDAENICAFSRLKELELFNLPNLGSICSSTIPFPSLERLLVYDCRKLKKLPSFKESNIPNKDICAFPRLKELRLTGLPNLGSICSSTIPFPSLELLHVFHCPELKKLPFKESNIPNKLREIRCQTEWWDSLECEDDNTKPLLERCLKKQ